MTNKLAGLSMGPPSNPCRVKLRNFVYLIENKLMSEFEVNKMMFFSSGDLKRAFSFNREHKGN